MFEDAKQFFDQLQERGRRSAGRIAYTSGVESITYAELLANVGKVAAHVERSVNSRNPVLIIGHKEPAMLSGFLGTAVTGRAYVPIDDKLPTERLESIREVARPSLELTAGEIDRVCRGIGEDVKPCTATPGDAVYVLFTSGSTGAPKGVVITWRGLLTFMNWMLAEHDFPDGEEVFLGQAPFSFDLSVMDLYLSLAVGGTHVSAPRETLGAPRALFELLSSARPTTWVSTPSFAAFCAADPTFRRDLLPDIRRLIFCGETLPHKLARLLLERFPGVALWNTYGPTECTVAVTSIRVTEELLSRHEDVPLGRAMPGTMVFLGDERRMPAQGGHRGEILIAGPSVSPGYLAHQELTQDRFFEYEGCWAYATGDWGSQKDGLLFFGGRIDQQVKINGYRIELEDVEQNLRKLPDVQNAVVVPIMRDRTVEGIAAFVETGLSEAESEFAVSQRLRVALSKKLPAYMLPKKWIFRENLPATANGKVDRKLLSSEINRNGQ
jgi:D-alanine--poly(phosphoribitol) ligase subunit 1